MSGYEQYWRFGKSSWNKYANSAYRQLNKSYKKLRTLASIEENILPNIFLPDLMALDSWDSKSNKIIYDQNIFNNETQTWSMIPSRSKKL